jgi:hypothetical protein
MEKSYYLFKNLDSYDTPENKPVSLLFRLLFKSRLYFYFYNYLIYCRTGHAGAKNKLDKENMLRLSSGNIHLVERCGGKFQIRGLENLRALNSCGVKLRPFPSLPDTICISLPLRPSSNG